MNSSIPNTLPSRHVTDRVVSEKKWNTEFFGEGQIRGRIRRDFGPEIREYAAKFVSNTGPNHTCLWGLMKCKKNKNFQTGVDIKENKMPKIRDFLQYLWKIQGGGEKSELYLIFTAIVGININKFGSLKVPVIRSQYGAFSPNPRITGKSP